MEHNSPPTMITTNFYELSPEVPGEFTGDAALDRNVWPIEVHNLELRLDAWDGAQLFTVHPCFFVDAALRDEIIAANFEGVSFDEDPVTVSTAEDLVIDAPALVPFFRLRAAATVRSGDFFINGQGRLVVSEAALRIIEKFNLGYFSAKPYG